MQITPLPREKATFAARKHHARFIQSLSVEHTPFLPLPLNGRRVGKTPPCAGAKNAACGDGNPRLRRWQSPRAAFGISAGGVWSPGYSHSTSLILRHFENPLASRPVCCDAIATFVPFPPISSFQFSPPPLRLPSRMLRCHRNLSNQHN